MRRFFRLTRPLLLGLFCVAAWTATPAVVAQAPASPDANAVIMALLQTMPTGGGYSASAETTRRLQGAVAAQNGLTIQPEVAKPSYCSGATYLVFLRALKVLTRPPLAANPPLVRALLIQGQPDGVGVWGRWNANGPGTACLFEELNLGRNFTSFDQAKPGDFMKIFWSPAVGRSEHGHSVVYLGRGTQGGVETVRFWSSNQPGGFGEKTVPRSRISHAIFSRLEYPERIANAVSLPNRNPYLAGLLSRDSTLAEAEHQSGVRDFP